MRPDDPTATAPNGDQDRIPTTAATEKAAFRTDDRADHDELALRVVLR